MPARISLFLLLQCFVVAFGACTADVSAADKEPEAKKDAEKKDEPSELGWRAFSAKIFEHGAWPLVVLVIFILFREQMRGLLARLTKFEAPGGLKGEFGKELQQVEEEATAAGLPFAL